MSGIVGVVNRDDRPVDRALLDRLTGSLAFRGPDGQRTWSDGPIGFGHALLRTFDDEPDAPQPLSLDGQVWITADARIDDRPEISAGLGAAGVLPSDAEVILRAYLAWGEECAAHLVGDFAFAIWDGRARRLFCVRDQLGVKPCYYADTPSALVVSNTLDCVRLHPGVSSELNDLAMADFLVFGHNLENDTTAFTGIRRLPAAHALIWTPSAGTRVRRYWRMPVREPLRLKRLGEYVERFDALLDRAVADRLRTRRAVVSLSGGMDSPTVAVSARRVLSRSPQPFELRATTVGFKRIIPDEECRYATLVAETLGIPIDLQVIDETGLKLFERREHRSLYQPEPRLLSGTARRFEQLRQVAARSRVLLTGHGGDLIFRPSPTYVDDAVRRLNVMPLLTGAWHHWRWYGRLPRLGFRTRRQMRRGINYQFTPFPDWLEPSLAARLDLKARWAAARSAAPEPVAHHRPEAYQLYADPKWARVFEGYDPERTGFLIEYRHPLFDVRLADFALSVPSMPLCLDKALLREAMRGQIPEVVRRRRKTPLVGDPHPALMVDSGGEWMANLPESPQLRRYIRSGVDVLSVKNPGHVRDFRPTCFNFWLESLPPPAIRPDVLGLKEEREDASAITGRARHDGEEAV